MSDIRVIVIGTKKNEVQESLIPNTLGAFQERVGGYIETTSFAELVEQDLILVCNEEGLLEGLPPNENLYPFFMVGQVIVTSYDYEGNFVSLSDEQVQFFDSWLDSLDN